MIHYLNFSLVSIKEIKAFDRSVRAIMSGALLRGLYRQFSFGGERYTAYRTADRVPGRRTRVIHVWRCNK